MSGVFFRKEIYTIEQVLPFVHFGYPPRKKGKHKQPLKDFDGDLITMASPRYKLFAKKGIVCVNCGLEGKFFAKERDRYGENANGRFHLNLYGIKDGFEVLLTKDHIYPVSLGGLNSLVNLQTMCEDCNHKKSADTPISKEDADKAGLTVDSKISEDMNVKFEKTKAAISQLLARQKMVAKNLQDLIIENAPPRSEAKRFICRLIEHNPKEDTKCPSGDHQITPVGESLRCSTSQLPGTVHEVSTSTVTCGEFND